MKFRFLPKSKNYLNLLLLAGILVIFVVIPLTVLLSQQSEQNAKNPQAATTLTLSVDQLIALRGDKAVPHEITIAPPVDCYWSWGCRPTEDTKYLRSSGSNGASGSANVWLFSVFDVSQFSSPPPVKLNVRRMAIWNHQPSNNQWIKLWDGLPQWYMNADLAFGILTDTTRTIEADGSYSFPYVPNMGLHMAGVWPWPKITEGDGIVTLVEARLLGTTTAISAAKVAMAAGADYRDSTGSLNQGFDSPGYYQSGYGQLGLLTSDWKAFYMLSSTLTDAQVRANPPPGFTSTVTVKTGDINGDNLVNGTDLAMLLSRWGSTDPAADISKNGKVDSADLAILLAHWGS